MGPEGAVNILYKREIDAAADKDAARAKRVAEFKEKFANPYVAASRGFVDEVIRPRQTRAADRGAGHARHQADTDPEEARQHPAVCTSTHSGGGERTSTPPVQRMQRRKSSSCLPTAPNAPECNR